MDKKTQDLMFSSKDLEAITPQDFYEQLNKEFRFETDLAADAKNTKCDYYFDVETNALQHPWRGRCWCNPPYGRTIAKWTGKAQEESLIVKAAPLVVMLLPARTDTRWFRIAADSASEIRFVKGRLTFEGNDQVAPFPSMVAIWYGDHIVTSKLAREPYDWNLIWRRGY